MGVKSNLSLIFKYLKLNLLKEMKYKTAFIMQIVGMTINDLFLLIQIIVICSVADNIGGFGQREMFLMISVSAGSYGIANLFFGGIFGFTNKVYNGMLDVYLTQPKHALINIACSSTDVSAIGDIVFAFIALALVNVSWWMYFIVIPVYICGALIIASMYATYSTLSFYIKNGGAVADSTLSALLITDRYPAGIYNLASRIILFTIIPALFYAFVPVEYIFTSFNIYWVLLYIGVTVIWVLIAFISFKLGLKKYNSGSLMGGRL